MSCTFKSRHIELSAVIASREVPFATVLIESHTYDHIKEAYISMGDTGPIEVAPEEAYAFLSKWRHGARISGEVRTEECDDAEHWPEDLEV